MINHSRSSARLRALITAVSIAAGLLFSTAPLADVTQPITRFQVGEILVTGPALRDAFMVSRLVTGLTDNHAYADKTILDGVTDYGGYGSFDSTVELRGSNKQNHLFTFQDRAKYSGSNALQNMSGFLSRSVHSGKGEIQFRAAIDIDDIQVTNGGKVGQNIGIYIRDLRSGNNNASITLAQSKGHTLYSSGMAPSYHRSNIVFGTGSGPVVGADVNQSQDIRNLSSAERAVAARLKLLIKASRSIGGGKIHIGIMAQDVIAAFKAEGLNAEDYAIINHDEQVIGVRNDELLAFVVSAL